MANILRYASWADIIHAQWTLTALFSLPAKWIFGKKIVLTARGSDLRLLPRWVNRFIHYQVDGAIDCFGPQPNNIRYKKTFAARFISLPLIVHRDDSGKMPEDMKEALSRKSDPFVILYVGRFDRLKVAQGFPILTLIRAGKILKSGALNFHVLYIGDGDSGVKRLMAQLVGDNDLQNDVTLLGPRVNVMDYMRFCQLGVGGIALNAVSQEFTVMGKPQILLDVEHNTQSLWKNGINAIFTKPEDEIDLAEKITWALTHREKSKDMGEKARKDMAEYITDGEAGGKLYLQAFENLIHERGRTESERYAGEIC